jgi:hypothetical protein
MSRSRRRTPGVRVNVPVGLAPWRQPRLRGLCVVAAALASWGCAEQPAKPRSTQPPINLSGYSAAFKAGFQDGCDTARGQTRRDAKRVEADAQYAQGWQDGRAICGKR